MASIVLSNGAGGCVKDPFESSERAMNGSTLDVRESRSVDILMESFPFRRLVAFCTIDQESLNCFERLKFRLM
jgi:hypothetical protein